MPYADSLTLILGADGFLGRNLVDTWRKRGWPCYPIGRGAGDFREASVVEALFAQVPSGVGRILHTITKQRTGSIQYALQGELLSDNARIHLNVLEAWRRYQPQAKLISLGSSCVYPESDKPLPEAAFRTGAPHESVRGYALAKEILATGCETYGVQYGLRWLHCVLATVYGPYAHTGPDRSHFMAALIARAVAAKAAGGDVLEVWGHPGTVRDLLYVSDQIDAILTADLVFENRIVNVTANAPVTIGTCAETIVRALDWPQARIVYAQGSFQGAGYKSLDSGRFLGATSWRPQVSLEAGVRQTLATMGEGSRAR